MLAEAKTLPDLRALRDYATGAKAWAKARGLGIEAENEATEVILRSEREIGKNLDHLRAEGKLATQGSWRVRPGGKGNQNKNVVASDVLHYDEIGVTRQQADDFRKLSSIEDERFEAMLRMGKATGRIAKVNFYSAIDRADKARRGVETSVTPSPNDANFDLLRRGAFGLLGWEVDADGTEGPTRNDLTKLPNDQLAQLATIIKALAIAYNEARGGR